MSKEAQEEQFDQLKLNIIKYISELEQKSIEMSELSEALDMKSSQDFKTLVNAVAELEREQRLELTPQGSFKLKEEDGSLITGIFSGTDRGFGFVMVEGEEKDIFIPGSQTKSAFNGDVVMIEITEEPVPWKDKSAEGRVVEVLERSVKTVIGEFHAYDDDEVKETALYGYVVANVKKMPKIPIQIETKGLHSVEGEIVQVEITQYPRYQGEDMKGIVKKTIGHRDEPGIEILSIVHKHGIPSEFPEEVIKEANQAPDSISEDEIQDRVDLRGRTIVTIDGADAKDLDDAIAVEKLNNGHYKLGVHIADVSYYVKENGPMDQEAFERGTSSYLTDRVIPMLPQRLSNGICSLHPNVDRLTLSCEMEIDGQGDVVDYDIYKSVIRSSQRMTYDAVNKILMDKDEEVRKEYETLVPMFEKMEELHHTLERKRKRRGAIDFDSQEAQIIVDEEGHPTDIELRERGVGERLIESFMLAANETVSEHYAKQHLPILYRIHETPDENKVQTFLEFITNFGIVVKGTKDNITPKNLQDALAKVKGKPEETVISMLLLRSMKQAKYDVEPVGHYGLAAEYYSHFTSPIRRYPDLILHRLIHYYDEVRRDSKAVKYWEEKLPEIAEQSSMAERRAIDAERETDELKKAEYMQQFVDEEFMGSIISITGFGMFIQLPNTVEGLVHISKMDDDYYEFHDRSLSMVGTRTGKVYKIGQPIKVKLTNVDTEEVQIDFEIAEDFAEVDSSFVSKSKKKKSSQRGQRGQRGQKGQKNQRSQGGQKNQRNQKSQSKQGNQKNTKAKKDSGRKHKFQIKKKRS